MCRLHGTKGKVVGRTWNLRGLRKALTPAWGVPRAVIRVPLLILLATCQVDKLTNTPPPVATLSVAPAEVRDSAALGSVGVDGDSLAVVNTGPGTLAWSARLALGGSWLAFVGATNGTAPAKLRLAFNPAGLPTGVYRDTVVVSAENASGSPGRVPVEFIVHPCMAVPIGFNVPRTDSLTTWDCAAPHRANSFARVYSFAANAGDSISVLMSSIPVDAYVVLDSALDADSLASNDSCGGAGGRDACLRYQRLPATRNYLIEATSAGVGQTGRFTLSVTRPRAPTAPAPATLMQLRTDSLTVVPLGGPTDQAMVVLRGLLADPDPSDSLRLEVEVRPVGTAFTGTPTQTGDRVANGQNGFVLVPGLANNTGYHWQARAADQTGRASDWSAFGGNAEAAPDFSTAVPEPPNAPTALAQFQNDGNTAIAVGGTALSRLVFFKAGVTDPNPGDSLRLDVEVRVVGTAFTGPTGSGPFVRNDTVATASNAAPLSDNAAYHWRARTVDKTGQTSAWVSFGDNGESATDFRVAVAVTQLAFTGQPSNAVAGTALSPAVRVSAQDAFGNTVTSFNGNVTIALATNAAGGTLSGTTTVPAVSGVATFPDLSIDKVATGYTLAAAASGLTTTSAGFTIAPAAATRLVFTVPPSDAPAGAAITPAVQVTARDAFGNTATGFTGNVTVAIGTNPGGGTLGGTATHAAVAGVATFSGLTIDKAGTGYTLTAAAGAGLTTGTSSPFSVTAATAGKLVLSTQPSTTAQSGVPLLRQPVVQIQDANGNPVSQAGVVVSALATPSGGTLTSGSATSDANGRATFSGLALSGPTGGYTLTFTAPTLAPVTSGGITLAAGPAAQLVVVTEPSAGAQNGVAFAQQPVLQLRDGAGNPVSQAGVTVTATIATGTGSLGGTASASSNASGVATFANLSLSGPAGSYTLSFGATGVIPATSAPITLGAGAATQLTLTTQPSAAAQSGVAFAQQPVVQLRDGAGNAVSQAGVTVTVTIASGGGSLGGTTTAITSASGIASFANLSLSGPAGSYTLGFGATGLTPATSGPITLGAGGSTHLRSRPSPPRRRRAAWPSASSRSCSCATARATR